MYALTASEELAIEFRQTLLDPTKCKYLLVHRSGKLYGTFESMSRAQRSGYWNIATIRSFADTNEISTFAGTAFDFLAAALFFLASLTILNYHWRTRSNIVCC